MAQRITLLVGDCLDRMAEMPDASFGSVVSDPPYLLHFAGRNWDLAPKADHDDDLDDALGIDLPPGHDHVAFHLAWLKHAFRLVRSGGSLSAFGGSRTFHRLARAIVQAGFEPPVLRGWTYGKAMPKSMNLSSAIDKDLGLLDKRPIIGIRPGHESFATLVDGVVVPDMRYKLKGDWDRPWTKDPVALARFHSQTGPASPQAAAWEGWGTALKGCWEPVLVARRP